MGIRDGLLVLAGAAAGAAFALWAAVPGAVDVRRAEGSGPAPSPEVPPPAIRAPAVVVLPAPAPAPTPVAGDGREIERRTLDLEVEAQRLLLARREGRDSAEGAEDRAADRERAALEVAPLLDRWRAAAPGEERAAAMKDLAMPLFRLLEAGGPAEHLLVLEESAERGETTAERKWAVIAAHRLGQAPAVDFLLARARSPHPEVRFYGVEGLAWVKGEERDRAVEGVVAGLEDPEPTVRGIAATSLGLIVADPARAEAILSRLGRETDPGAAEAMARAVLRLDPVNGKERVRAAAK